MARLRLVIATAGAPSVLWFAAGCSSATAPRPPIAGEYVGTVTVTLSAPGDSVLSYKIQPGWFLFDSASGSGAFTGGYGIEGTVGEMIGQEAANGSLRFTAFGTYQPPSRPPLENDSFVASLLPGCDWSTATDGEMTGQVVQPAGGAAGSVTITGSVQVQCTVSGSSSPAPSTVTFTASGARASSGTLFSSAGWFLRG